MVNVEHLKVGSWYQFVHKRKNAFVAKLVNIVESADPHDPVQLEVDIWTQDGSGQERFANCMDYSLGSKRRPMYARKLLRPSLIESVESPSSSEQKRFKAIEENEAAFRERQLTEEERPVIKIVETMKPVEPPKEPKGWLKKTLDWFLEVD